MPMAAPDDTPRPLSNTRRVTVARETDSVKIARIEEAVGGMREDLADIKATLGSFDHRVAYLEDVRVRAIEDREIARKAVADERARAADAARHAAEQAQQAAAEAATHADQKLTRRQAWTIAAITCAVAILCAVIGSVVSLIASGHLF